MDLTGNICLGRQWWQPGCARAVTIARANAMDEMTSGPPMTLKFSSAAGTQSRFLAVADEDGTVNIYDTQNLELTHQAGWVAHADSIFSVAWLDNDHKFVTASGDQTLRIWDLQSLRPIQSLSGHTGSVKWVDVSPHDPNMLISASRDGSVLIWDLRSPCFSVASHICPANAPITRLRAMHIPQHAVQPLPSSSTAAFRSKTASAGAGARKRKASTTLGKSPSSSPLSSRRRRHPSSSGPDRIPYGVSTALFLPSSPFAFVSTGASDGHLKIWDSRTLAMGPLAACIPGAQPEGGGTTLSPASVSVGGGAAVAAAAKRRLYGITSLSLHPGDQSTLLVSNTAGRHVVMDTSVASRPVSRAVYDAGIASSFYQRSSWLSAKDKYVFAAAGADAHVRVWDTSRDYSGEARMQKCCGHQRDVSDVAAHQVLPHCFATVSDDCSVRLWDMPHRSLSGISRGVDGVDGAESCLSCQLRQIDQQDNKLVKLYPAWSIAGSKSPSAVSQTSSSSSSSSSGCSSIR